MPKGAPLETTQVHMKSSKELDLIRKRRAKLQREDKKTKKTGTEMGYGAQTS